MLITKAEAQAKYLQKKFFVTSLNSLIQLPLPDLVLARDCFYEEVNLKSCDGRFMFSNNQGIISINSLMRDKKKKRFVIAHELAHYELHKDLENSSDNQLKFFNWFKMGGHEKEANEFAAELLMPTKIFRNFIKGKEVNPNLFENISDEFQVTIQNVLLNWIRASNQNAMIVCVINNKVRWWKMSEPMADKDHPYIPRWVDYVPRITSNLSPPVDSVVGQMFKEKELNVIESYDQIEKSTWFKVKPKEDRPMFEYAVLVPHLKFALSLIWED
ncbi:MAG: ImmA/IrrE family metallo-endopeptidase [Cyclobacteriaceae bacterium]|nr:ImmA/IrrE family metallo-endopeptidase [Cyclobacteriaceae bacterium]